MTASFDTLRYAEEYFSRSAAALDACRSQTDVLVVMASRMVHALDAGGTIFWMGNGGSAADAQHLSTELVARFRTDRRALRSVAMTTDTSLLTAVANDWDFAQVFIRQVQALVRPGDIVVGISTSGHSRNILLALDEAHSIGACTMGLFGLERTAAALSCDYSFHAPSSETSHIQECHIAAGQLICALVEQHYVDGAL